MTKRLMGSETNTYLFITGNSRSGTTLMSRILAHSDQVHSLHEIHFFGNIIAAGKEHSVLSKNKAVILMATLLSAERDGIFKKRNPQAYREEASAIFQIRHETGFTCMEVYRLFLDYMAAQNRKSFICEQTPYYLFYFEEIIEAFPGALFINMVRDPRDILLSQKRRWQRRYLGASYVPFRESVRTFLNYHPVVISKMWRSAQAKACSIQHPNFRTVRFEDLVHHPVTVIKEICRFIDIPFSEHMLQVPVTGSSSETDTEGQTGIDSTKLQRWQKGGLNNTEIYLCEKINNTFISKYQYAFADVQPSKVHLFYYRFSLPVKMFFALLLNWKRIKNFRSIIKRRFK